MTLLKKYLFVLYSSLNTDGLLFNEYFKKSDLMKNRVRKLASSQISFTLCGLVLNGVVFFTDISLIYIIVFLVPLFYFLSWKLLKFVLLDVYFENEFNYLDS